MSSNLINTSETIGYFNVPVDKDPDVYLRFNVHKVINLLSDDTKAVLVVPGESVGGYPTSSQCAIIKRLDDVINVRGTVDWSIPKVDSSALGVPLVLVISPGTVAVVHANGRKYHTSCEFVAKDPSKNTRICYNYAFQIPHGRNPSVLDHLEKFKLSTMSTPQSQEQPSRTPVKETLPAISGVKIEFEITRGKCVGVDCWKIPYGMKGTLKFKINRDVDFKNWRIVTKSSSSVSTLVPVPHGKETDVLQIDSSANYFWVTDLNENLVEFNIVSVTL
jgi:hypothetical protein